MRTLLAILLTVLLAGWLALVVSLAPTPGVYVWTVEPVTAPPSEVVEKGSQHPAGCLVVWLF